MHVNIMPDAECSCPSYVTMGGYENQIPLKTPEHMRGKKFGWHTVSEVVGIDRCIAKQVQALWAAGFITTGCCCGHGIKTGYIGIFISPVLNYEPEEIFPAVSFTRNREVSGDE